MFKLLKNPFYIYVLGFSFTFLVYNFGWSDMYPPLSKEMKVFFTIAFIFFLFFGFLISKLKLIRKTIAGTKIKLLSRSLHLVYLLYFIEILYERDAPLFALALGRPGIDYAEFGIPLLHGILISFNSFLIAHSFAIYMSTKRRKVLIYNILLYLPALIIINRSIIVFGVLTSVFIYVHFVKRVKIKNQLKIGLLALIGLYVFGVLGNFRAHDGGEYIYKQSKAKPSILNSSIPREYYWTYLYVGSPLANFQNTVNKRVVKDYYFKGFVFYENLPKIISKNLGEPLGVERRDLVRVVPWLTVGTTYARSFSYLGWNGPYLLFFSSLLIYVAFFFLVPRESNYHITTISILSVMVLLNIFTNMMIVTGISFQLAYCVIFAFFERKKFVYSE